MGICPFGCLQFFHANKFLSLSLFDHADTIATGPTDIGYCDLLQHDVDTGDIFPIKQSLPVLF